MRTQNKQIIKKAEGCKLKAYLCPAGVWTVGYGHTGSDVYEGLEIDQATADRLLERDLNKFQDYVAKYVKVEISQNQHDALVSFIYNIGPTAFRDSTLLKLLNQEKYDEAALELFRWVHAGGKKLKGLVNRRRAEYKLFTTKEFIFKDQDIEEVDNEPTNYCWSKLVEGLVVWATKGKGS